MYLYDTEKNLFIMNIPNDLDDVEENLLASVRFVKDLAQEYINDQFGTSEEGVHLFMENKTIIHKGEKTKCILVFASEFPIGIMVTNANMEKSNLIGPYSTKTKTLYKQYMSKVPEG